MKTLLAILITLSLFSCKKEEIQINTQDQIQGEWILDDIEWRADDNTPWSYVESHTDHSFEITETHIGGSPYTYNKCTDIFNVIDEEDGQDDQLVHVHSFNGSNLVLYYVNPNGQNVKYYLKK